MDMASSVNVLISAQGQLFAFFSSHFFISVYTAKYVHLKYIIWTMKLFARRQRGGYGPIVRDVLKDHLGWYLH